MCVHFLFPSWLYLLMNTSGWKHLSKSLLCTLALSLSYHTTPQLAFLIPILLNFPMQVQFQTFHKHWKGGNTKERKKKNPGHIFCNYIPATSQRSLCGVTIYYNIIHKLMLYYLKMWNAFCRYKGHFLHLSLK